MFSSVQLGFTCMSISVAGTVTKRQCRLLRVAIFYVLVFVHAGDAFCLFTYMYADAELCIFTFLGLITQCSQMSYDSCVSPFVLVLYLSTLWLTGALKKQLSFCTCISPEKRAVR